MFGEITNGEMQLNPAGQMVKTTWQFLPERFPSIELGVFIIMPNHFHAIVIIHELVGTGIVTAPVDGDSSVADAPGATGATIKVAPTLGQIIGAFKINLDPCIRPGREGSGLAPFRQTPVAAQL